ncbi:hypothetical protein ACTWPT_56275 [Nonomuraea sp. 3N208]|uniref:hypothetical protein n=1 Tax=Nonomuraea sp. 3N208 TaxID=3457421 RepID=UPI003FD3D7B5
MVQAVYLGHLPRWRLATRSLTAPLLAANAARNAANAVRRAELVKQARAIAAARAADAAQAPVDVRPATVVRAPLHNRLTTLMAKHDDGSRSQQPGTPGPTRPVEQQARPAGPARTAVAPDQPERTLQDRLADLMAKHARRR